MGTGQGRGSATKVAVMSVVGGVAAPTPAGPLGMLPCTLCVRTCVCVRVCERQRQADRGRGRVCGTRPACHCPGAFARTALGLRHFPPPRPPSLFLNSRGSWLPSHLPKDSGGTQCGGARPPGPSMPSPCAPGRSSPSTPRGLELPLAWGTSALGRVFTPVCPSSAGPPASGTLSECSRNE